MSQFEPGSKVKVRDDLNFKTLKSELEEMYLSMEQFSKLHNELVVNSCEFDGEFGFSVIDFKHDVDGYVWNPKWFKLKKEDEKKEMNYKNTSTLFELEEQKIRIQDNIKHHEEKIKELENKITEHRFEIQSLDSDLEYVQHLIDGKNMINVNDKVEFINPFVSFKTILRDNSFIGFLVSEVNKRFLEPNVLSYIGFVGTVVSFSGENWIDVYFPESGVNVKLPKEFLKKVS